MVRVFKESFIVTWLSDARLVADFILATEPSSKERVACEFRSTPCSFNSASQSIPLGLRKSFPLTIPTASLEIDIG